MSPTYDFGDSETKADGRIKEGHDGGDDGKPPHLIEIWDLRQQNLYETEHDHVGISRHMTRVCASALVEAVGPFDRPVVIKTFLYIYIHIVCRQ